MELTINKKTITRVINDLPEDATLEDAMERLMMLHKIQIGLEESGGKTQEEVEEIFRQRRESRKG